MSDCGAADRQKNDDKNDGSSRQTKNDGGFMSADTAENGRAHARAFAIARPTHVRWYVLALISLMYMITYMDRSNISIAAPAIVKEFGFSKTEIALLFSAFAWAYAAGQGPGGWRAQLFVP